MFKNVPKKTKKNKKVTKIYKKSFYPLKTPNGCVKIVIRIKSSEFWGKYFKFLLTTNEFTQLLSLISENLETRDNIRQERKKHMSSVRDAANYLLRLYYYGNRNCTSAVIQKLLIVAQMRSLYLHDTPLFEDDLFVKPTCFSIRIISNTYPDIIFNEETRFKLIDTYNEDCNINISDINRDALPNLSSFYDIFDELNQQEINIITETYCEFGCFSGKCIGEFMCDLKLHKSKDVFTTVSIREIKEYLKNPPLEDCKNAIMKFIFS